jgi:hypothetical protein
MELFKFELEENNTPKDDTNINRVCVYVNDEQKEQLHKMESIFKKNRVDNLSDYLIKKVYEDIEIEKRNS